MRIFFILLIVFFSFSFSFAQHRSDYNEDDSYDDVPSLFSVGVLGSGYVPLGSDKELLGYGAGAGLKAVINMNKFFGIGLSTSLTGAKSNYNGGNNYTLLSTTRLLFIFQKETDRFQKGFVPWFGLGIGLTALFGDYSIGKTKGMVGFDMTLMAGLRYNFKNAYVGIGAEYITIGISGDMVYNNKYQTRETTSIDISGVNIFGEIGFRF